LGLLRRFAPRNDDYCIPVRFIAILTGITFLFSQPAFAASNPTRIDHPIHLKDGSNLRAEAGRTTVAGGMARELKGDNPQPRNPDGTYGEKPGGSPTDVLVAIGSHDQLLFLATAGAGFTISEFIEIVEPGVTRSTVQRDFRKLIDSNYMAQSPSKFSRWPLYKLTKKGEAAVCDDGPLPIEEELLDEMHRVRADEREKFERQIGVPYSGARLVSRDEIDSSGIRKKLTPEQIDTALAGLIRKGYLSIHAKGTKRSPGMTTYELNDTIEKILYARTHNILIHLPKIIEEGPDYYTGGQSRRLVLYSLSEEGSHSRPAVSTGEGGPASGGLAWYDHPETRNLSADAESMLGKIIDSTIVRPTEQRTDLFYIATPLLGMPGLDKEKIEAALAELTEKGFVKPVGPEDPALLVARNDRRDAYYITNKTTQIYAAATGEMGATAAAQVIAVPIAPNKGAPSPAAAAPVAGPLEAPPAAASLPTRTIDYITEANSLYDSALRGELTANDYEDYAGKISPTRSVKNREAQLKQLASAGYLVDMRNGKYALAFRSERCSADDAADAKKLTPLAEFVLSKIIQSPDIYREAKVGNLCRDSFPGRGWDSGLTPFLAERGLKELSDKGYLSGWSKEPTKEGEQRLYYCTATPKLVEQYASRFYGREVDISRYPALQGILPQHEVRTNADVLEGSPLYNLNKTAQTEPLAVWAVANGVEPRAEKVTSYRILDGTGLTLEQVTKLNGKKIGNVEFYVFNPFGLDFNPTPTPASMISAFRATNPSITEDNTVVMLSDQSLVDAAGGYNVQKYSKTVLLNLVDSIIASLGQPKDELNSRLEGLRREAASLNFV